MKVCVCCGNSKQEDQFYRKLNNCNTCRLRKGREYRELNKEDIIRKGRDYYRNKKDGLF